jgi:hypothetical protein
VKEGVSLFNAVFTDHRWLFVGCRLRPSTAGAGNPVGQVGKTGFSCKIKQKTRRKAPNQPGKNLAISLFMLNFAQNNTTLMEETAAYRARITQALADARDANGRPLLTDDQVKKLSQQFSDEELEDGMLFNTPEEVAELLIESGLE